MLEEPNVHLLIPFASTQLLELLDPRLTILWYHANTKALQYCAPAALKGAPQPEIRNFIVEFSPGAPIVYCPDCGAAVTPTRTDRLIIRNRYAYYAPDGRVDRDLTYQHLHDLSVSGLFGFESRMTGGLSADEQRRVAEAAATDRYDMLFVAGLQSLDRTAHALTEQELEIFWRQGTRVHVEISGEKQFDWLIGIIPKYVESMGIGEELDALYYAATKAHIAWQVNLGAQFQEQERLERLEADLQGKTRGYQKVRRALELARALKLKRLYVHDLDIDIVIRENQLDERDRLHEIHSDLVAKWVVLRKLMSRGQISRNQTRDTMTQVKEAGFTALVQAAQELYQWLGQEPSASLELYGAYVKEYQRTMVLIPVRWVYGAMQDQLRVIGAGDTTSLINAVQAMEPALGPAYDSPPVVA
jgi:hypothetical protein